MSVLFNEAIQALSEVRILSNEEGNEVIEQFINSFPIQRKGAGRIDWDKIKKKTSLSNIEEVKSLDDFDLDKKCYIIWNDESYPVIESIADCVINVFDDVVAVNFDTWIFIQESKKVIENIPSGINVNL